VRPCVKLKINAGFIGREALKGALEVGHKGKGEKQLDQQN